jgi:hypothetical protein
VLTAIAVRSISLQWSSLPYNIDGLSEYRITGDIVRTGHLNFTPESSQSVTYIVDMPIMGLFVAFLSSFLGIDPLHLCQSAVAMIGAITALLVFIIFREHLQSFKGAICATMVLATVGSFVFASGCVWKETLGLLLICLALYSFSKRDDLRFRVVMTLSLILLIVTHHYSAIIALVIISFVLLMHIVVRARFHGFPANNSIPDLLTISLSWAVAVSYYLVIDLPYLDFLSPRTDLYLFVAVTTIMVLIGAKTAYGSTTKPSRIPIGLAVPVVGASLMVYNYFDPLFSAIPGPSSLIAAPFFAYLVLVAPAWEGIRVALAASLRSRTLLLSLLLCPLSFITFAFLRSQDATSHMIIYRTFDFMMIGFAILVGLGFAHMIKGRPRVGVACGVGLVIVCASTLPIAYNSQELFGVQNHTFGFEYDAVEWFSENDVSDYVSDQRLGETGWRLFDIGYGRGLPYDLKEGLSLNSSAFFVIEEQWSTNGAQEFPFGVVVVPTEIINETLSENSVVYVGGPTDNNIICFLTRP